MAPKKATIIVDGEIYSGLDDPRYILLLENRRRQQPQPQQSRHTQQPVGPAAGNPVPARPAGNAINWSAAPFAMEPAGGGAMFGLPDLVVFGFKIPSAVALGLGLLTFQFGWRALVAGGTLYYIWQVNLNAGPQPQQQRPAAPGPATAGGGLADNLAGGLAGVMNSLGLGPPPPADPSAQRQQQEQGGQAAGRQQAGAQQFQGRGNRLGGSD
mmetsp:Transcript_4405/g.7272  ORF Transcript_4405/g.7272 Transcript_4405/m.7272 type:complete len:212 (-) Transcript_4405:438-1073(-)|eukprot:CAMPEP_0119103284 /NCGR_PEP_ID=MMETSP1180-20130426/1748_1 /TAXON_ID=3052 ORGANISM="Chlamydomonas cf sp, Strain CCMP681" /NCGR_SAMPLE_ID=MMETSP1180 /ASSEMBLY_ACC=CAM_ASM_000741 /LENGTH=211 /DNA_ID=CAMNT_0007087739 /DNA_START=100 /DNA_END=735 /DNA_ORIENTATION=+